MNERLLDKYKLLEEVGHGGMAIVYRGMDTTLNREVAVKILHAHLAEELESRQRFQREAQAVAKLRHDNIIEIYDYSGLESPQSFIVTEFIHGQTLKEYLARHPISHPEIAVMVIIEVCTALEHAHSFGVIHRDIKPENIMIRNDGRVKLTDFGIAQVIDVQRLTVTGQLLGSPAYMAPELVEGKRIDFRADVFSVGTLLYQLTTTELPFKGKNPHEVLKRIADGRFVDPEVANPVVGSQLAAIIRKALAHDPVLRYGNVITLKEDLLEFLREVAIHDPRAELACYFASPVEYSCELQARVVKILTEKGKVALQRRKTPAALAYFNRVLCADPSNQEVVTLLGQIARRRRVGRIIVACILIMGLFTGIGLLGKYWPLSGPALLSDGSHSRKPPPVDDLGSTASEHALPISGQLDGRSDSIPRDLSPSSKQNKIIHRPPIAPQLKTVAIIPTPKAVTIWLNGKKLGDYGPDLRQVLLPLATLSRLTFRNEACCFEREILVGPKDIPKVLNVRLPWKPARVQVLLSPSVEADVIIGSLVTRPGQLTEVPIPSYSDDGKDSVEVKISAKGYSTETREVTVRANTIAKITVKLRRFP